jgi:hypothetical protein
MWYDSYTHYTEAVVDNALYGVLAKNRVRSIQVFSEFGRLLCLLSRPKARAPALVRAAGRNRN